MSDYYHLEVLLEIGSKKSSAEVTEAFVQNTIVQALNNLFGEFGAAIPVEVEKFERNSQGATFIIKCPAHSYVKLRSSLTLQSTFQSLTCAFHILRVGTTLLELINTKTLIKL